jgi:bifunctional DNA-binding transcriptional regulator/antitoxin component of YhaV-PrlF toxin-antitoxin module
LSMAIAHSKITAQGRTSVPVEVRRRLGVGPGSMIEWIAEEERIGGPAVRSVYVRRHSSSLVSEKGARPSDAR